MIAAILHRMIYANIVSSAESVIIFGTNMRYFGEFTFYNFTGAIFRTVIDNDDFFVLISHSAQRLQAKRCVAIGIQVNKDNADAGIIHYLSSLSKMSTAIWYLLNGGIR